jgi:hypothetical protein
VRGGPGQGQCADVRRVWVPTLREGALRVPLPHAPFSEHEARRSGVRTPARIYHPARAPPACSCPHLRWGSVSGQAASLNSRPRTSSILFYAAAHPRAQPWLRGGPQLRPQVEPSPEPRAAAPHAAGLAWGRPGLLGPTHALRGGVDPCRCPALAAWGPPAAPPSGSESPKSPKWIRVRAPKWIRECVPLPSTRCVGALQLRPQVEPGGRVPSPEPRRPTRTSWGPPVPSSHATPPPSACQGCGSEQPTPASV